MTVVAKAGIEQCLTRDDVRGALAADHERSGVGGGGYGGFPQNSHGMSFLAPDRSGGPDAVCKISEVVGGGPADRGPDFSSPPPGRGGWVAPGRRLATVYCRRQDVPLHVP